MLVLALVLVSQHWLSVISGVAAAVLFSMDVARREEQGNIKKFGDDYKRCMEKVLRKNSWLG